MYSTNKQLYVKRSVEEHHDIWSNADKQLDQDIGSCSLCDGGEPAIFYSWRAFMKTYGYDNYREPYEQYLKDEEKRKQHKILHQSGVAI